MIDDTFLLCNFVREYYTKPLNNFTFLNVVLQQSTFLNLTHLVTNAQFFNEK